VGILAIDTVSDSMVVAFDDDGTGEPRVRVHGETREHTRALLSLIDDICGGDRSTISSIVVVRGPGAYAGLRVGVATAQSLGLALGVPVAGVTSFEAAYEAAFGAEAVPRASGIHPAGRGEFAVQDFEGGTPAGESRVIGPDELQAAGLFGEGAASLGGRDVAPLARCLAALRLHRRGATAEAAALYVREPHITLPKGKVATGPEASPQQ
jgi:tRNA threonylcarbamoyladenosine biosynthesis protein TsaB